MNKERCEAQSLESLDQLERRIRCCLSKGHEGRHKQGTRDRCAVLIERMPEKGLDETLAVLFDLTAYYINPQIIDESSWLTDNLILKT